jgi:tRNA(Ile)-lysidine synthase
MTAILQTVLHTIQQNKLIPFQSTLVVGVSGGADSLALLHILNRLTGTLQLTLHVATLDHRLRGDAGADDARFVENLARQWQIPVTSASIDAGEYARAHHIGSEAAARRIRYDFLAAVVREMGTTRVAVAHHISDQAETVLMHIIRGTGLHGLRGMDYSTTVPGNPDLTLIRPLLNVTRAEIDQYCREHDLQPRVDLTNRDMTYLRNYIRSQTIPHLQAINPRVEHALIQLADIAAVEDEYLAQQINALIDWCVTVSPDRVSIDRAIFREQHPALQRRLIHWAAARFSGTADDVAYVPVVDALAVAERGRLGALARLKEDVRLRVDYETLVIEREASPILIGDECLLEDPNQEIVVNIPGVTALSDRWRLRASRTPGEPIHARLTVPESRAVIVRPRRTGDRFAPLGMGGHTKKLTDWMIDQKIPRHLREKLPLLVIDGEIAAVIYGHQWAISDRFSVDLEGKTAVFFAVQKDF